MLREDFLLHHRSDTCVARTKLQNILEALDLFPVDRKPPSEHSNAFPRRSFLLDGPCQRIELFEKPKSRCSAYRLIRVSPRPPYVDERHVFARDIAIQQRL